MSNQKGTKGPKGPKRVRLAPLDDAERENTGMLVLHRVTESDSMELYSWSFDDDQEQAVQDVRKQLKESLADKDGDIAEFSEFMQKVLDGGNHGELTRVEKDEDVHWSSEDHDQVAFVELVRWIE